MTRGRKNIRHRNLIASIIILLIIGIVFYVASFGFTVAQTNGVKQILKTNATYNIPNLDVADVISATHDSNYALAYINRVTLFSPGLIQMGYLASASSMFNFTGSINNTITVPATIGSAVFLMKNSSLATSYVNSMLASNNANQSIRGYVLNNTNVSNYGSGGKKIYIYTMGSVAVFNTSVIGLPNTILPMPDYQYTSIFSYNNAVGTVVINGYTGKLNGTLSRVLAEDLATKMIADKCCYEN